MSFFAGLSVILFVVGFVCLLDFRGRALRRRVLATPTTRIADATGQGIVEILGTFRCGDGEEARGAPFTGKPALWWQLRIESVHSGANGTQTHEKEYEETTPTKELWVDDGSGELARLEIEGARLEVAEEKLDKAPADARAFCETHGLQCGPKYEFYERAIYEGDPAYALGLSRRDPGPPRQDEYRDAPSTQLVLFGANLALNPSARQEQLVVANKKQEQLVSSLNFRTAAGIVCLVLGAALGILYLVVGLVTGQWA